MAVLYDAQEGAREVKAVTVENIHDAAKVGDVQVIMRFIDSDKKLIDSKDGRGITPLGVAVGFNRLEAIKTLLASGASPNLTDSQGDDGCLSGSLTTLLSSSGFVICCCCTRMSTCTCRVLRVLVPHQLLFPGFWCIFRV